MLVGVYLVVAIVVNLLLSLLDIISTDTCFLVLFLACYFGVKNEK